MNALKLPRPLFSVPLALALSTATTVHAGSPLVFVTNWYAQAEHGGFYQAQADGLYQKAGVDVTLRMGGPQVNAMQLLVANRAQCAISDDIATMNARAKGAPVELVATTFQRDPTVLIAHDDVADFAAMKTRTLLASSNANVSWLPWAKAKFGFTDEQVRPYTFNIQPFMADRKVVQQGYLTSEPFALEQAGAKFKVFPLSDAGYPPYGNAIVCRDDFVAAHKDTVAAFLKATMQGWKNYLANPAAGNEVIRKENPNMGAAQLDYAVRKLRDSGLVTGGDAKTKGIGIITAERIKASWMMAVGNGLVDGKLVSADKVFDTSIIDNIKVLP